MSSVFERIGGAAAVEVAVDVFYKKVLADENLKPFFKSVDMTKQRGHMKSFLTMAFGGPSGYTGRDLRSGHKALVDQGLTDSHFDAVMGHLGDTLQQLGVADVDIAEIAIIGEGTRADVLNK